MTSKERKLLHALDATKKDDLEKKKASFTLASSFNAAAIIDSYTKSLFGDQQADLIYVYEALNDSINKVQDGDLKKCEAMLFSQATALQSIFTNLATRASRQECVKNLDALLRLGMKAQAQSVRTIEVLAQMKNPRSVAFVNQANIATNQQVNNTQTSSPENSEITQSKLTGESHELYPHTGTPSIESSTNPTLETLGKKHRTKVSQRKGKGSPE